MASASISWLAKLSDQHVIVTANRRLALYWQEQYAAYQRGLGHTVWQTLDIIPYQSWLVRCYQSGIDNGLLTPQLLLNEQQELSIWETIISHSARPLLQLAAVAKEAKRAWQLLWEWQCSLDHPSFTHSEDCTAFQQWAQQFQQHLTLQQWLDCSQLPEIVYNLLQQHSELMPRHMVWLGFIELVPQQQKIIELLLKQGSTCQQFAFSEQVATVHCLTAPNQATEIRTMARWAKNLLNNPAHRVGCIVPDIAAIRPELLRTFTEIFVPELLLEPNNIDTRLPFNISAGLALHEYPIIYAALQALQLNQAQIPTSVLLHLLRAPFFGPAAELFAQVRLQGQLRPYHQHKFSPPQLLSWLQSQKVECQWLRNMIQLISHITHQTTQQAPSQWAQSFSEQLELLGWPGERTLNSEEYQLLQKWQALLAGLASLDIIYPSLSSKMAWTKLQALAAATLFQPQTPESKLQILGTLEAVGQRFTHLWVMGLDDNHWPSKPSPNNFLPLSLQRDKLMPQASSERETDYCKRLLSHYYQSSAQVIVSYSQQAADTMLRPSRLINELTCLGLNELMLADDIQLAELVAAAAKVEEVELSSAPPVSAPELVRGGVGLLKSQAACAFKAFAEYRLGAKLAETWELGIAATERGNLLHSCLEYIWGRLGSQQQLLKLTAQELLDIIQQAIAQAISQFKSTRATMLNHKLWQIESQRLTKLLLAWLEKEKQRKDFTVIATEQAVELNLGGLALTLKIDRIDQLASGEYVIIDYKTSKVQAQWQAEHLTEPQLPLYCISSPYPIAAVSLAQVRNDEMKFHGLAQSDGLLPQLKTADDWQNMLASWQQLLEQLGAQFLAGHAAIAPRDKQTCELCQLELVCRIRGKAVVSDE
jgi:ATP-dependent helicase/nuclease subunit B